jgi:hypothetical protein
VEKGISLPNPFESATKNPLNLGKEWGPNPQLSTGSASIPHARVKNPQPTPALGMDFPSRFPRIYPILENQETTPEQLNEIKSMFYAVFHRFIHSLGKVGDHLV